MDVYKAINEVHKELAKVGISKNDFNSFDKYKFRGIDSVYNTVSPILAKHGLIILPEVVSCETQERTSKHGGSVYNSVVNVRFDMISSSDGSKHTISTFGEGLDRGDKSINKALTAAYKYALFQCFCIPIEGSDSEGEPVELDTGGKPELTPHSPRWAGAVDMYKRTKKLDTIREYVYISPENEQLLIKQGA